MQIFSHLFTLLKPLDIIFCTWNAYNLRLTKSEAIMNKGDTESRFYGMYRIRLKEYCEHYRQSQYNDGVWKEFERKINDIARYYALDYKAQGHLNFESKWDFEKVFKNATPQLSGAIAYCVLMGKEPEPEAVPNTFYFQDENEMLQFTLTMSPYGVLKHTKF